MRDARSARELKTREGVFSLAVELKLQPDSIIFHDAWEAPTAILAPVY